MAAHETRERVRVGRASVLCVECRPRTQAQNSAHRRPLGKREWERETAARARLMKLLAWLACRIHEIQIHLSDCVRSSNETVVSAERDDLLFVFPTTGTLCVWYTNKIDITELVEKLRYCTSRMRGEVHGLNARQQQKPANQPVFVCVRRQVQSKVKVKERKAREKTEYVSRPTAAFPCVKDLWKFCQIPLRNCAQDKTRKPRFNRRKNPAKAKPAITTKQHNESSDTQRAQWVSERARERASLDLKYKIIKNKNAECSAKCSQTKYEIPITINRTESPRTIRTLSPKSQFSGRRRTAGTVERPIPQHTPICTSPPRDSVRNLAINITIMDRDSLPRVPDTHGDVVDEKLFSDLYIRTSWVDAQVALDQIDKVSAQLQWTFTVKDSHVLNSIIFLNRIRRILYKFKWKIWLFRNFC